MAIETYDDNTTVKAAIQTKLVNDLTELFAATAAITAGSGVLVSSDDTDVGYLNGKLLAGEGIDFTEGNGGADETLTIKGEDASETNKGIVELATNGETVTGTDTTRATTPANVAAKLADYTKDEDDMASDSAAHVATQQSIKAYVDASAILPTNYITGVVLSNDTDTEHDINVTSGEARDSTDAADIVLASEITKQIDAAWSVGDDAGGMDTGTVSTSTLYAVWVIKRSDTGVVDALFSTSFSSPTMPTNYDYKRLLGWVLTDGSANIIQFLQLGNGSVVQIEFTARQQIATGLSQTSLTAQAVNAIFPTAGMTVLGIQYGGIGNTSWSYFAIGYDATNVMAIATKESGNTAVGQISSIGYHSTPRMVPPNGNNCYYMVNLNQLTLFGLGCIIQR